MICVRKIFPGMCLFVLFLFIYHTSFCQQKEHILFSYVGPSRWDVYSFALVKSNVKIPDSFVVTLRVTDSTFSFVKKIIQDTMSNGCSDSWGGYVRNVYITYGESEQGKCYRSCRGDVES